jgi:acetate---CoA ligase (ADP-forming)
LPTTDSVLDPAKLTLRDGSQVCMRSIAPVDERALLSLFESLSKESRKLRFFTAAPALRRIAHDACNLDARTGFGLVATRDGESPILGHAAYTVIEPGCAEVAFVVADETQGLGLATLLLAELAEHAARQGIHTFKAIVLPANLHMLEVFRDSGFPVDLKANADCINVTFPTRLNPRATEHFERREQIAAATALRRFLQPRSVAVIGASRTRGTPGGEVFHNLLAGAFVGPVYPVNPVADVVQSVRAYPSIADVPDTVDLAVIAVPGQHVVEVAEQCAQKGVSALVVLSAGFAEAGDDGRRRQAELVRVCRSSGMRLVGPNCIGVANTDPAVRLNATFGPLAPSEGPAGFVSQSGALGLSAMGYAAARGLGISSFVSAGDKADVSSNDLLNYWESDPRTRLILLYLESFGNPRKFARIARRVGKQKPILAVKSGRSTAGARAAASHTGALLATSDVTIDALFRQAGVVRTDTLEELFDAAVLLACQPLPVGRRIGIVTNVGGPAILCADACESVGLTVATLSPETQALLRDFLPTAASLSNPVDMLATATAEQYQRTIETVAADAGVDAVIVLFIPPLAGRDEEIADAILDGARGLDRSKPVLAVVMSSAAAEDRLRRARPAVPLYDFPEPAAVALGHAARYAEWRSQPVRQQAQLDDLRRDDALAIVAQALGRGDSWLDAATVADLLRCYGFPLVEQSVAGTPDEAGRAAEQMGGSVALKGFVPGLLHKTEAGLVRLELIGPEQVCRAAGEMAAACAERGETAPTFLVQRMGPSGVEMIVGVVHDPQFGPVLACGAGGTLVELLKDVVVRLTPLVREDAAEMIHELKTYPLLEGYRGSPPRDVAALEDILLRVSALADDIPQIVELDLNPVVVLSEGCAVLDARIRLGSS